MDPTLSPPSENTTETVEQQKLLNFGFRAGVVLASACLLGVAIYLGLFQYQTNEAIKQTFGISQLQDSHESVRQIALLARLNIAHLQLLSCGIVVGLTFGFIGFTLFLLGIKSETNAEGEGAGYKLKLEKLAPGLFVIVCATVIVMTCILNASRMTLNLDLSDPAPATGSKKSDSPQPTSGSPNEKNDSPPKSTTAPKTASSPTSTGAPASAASPKSTASPTSTTATTSETAPKSTASPTSTSTPKAELPPKSETAPKSTDSPIPPEMPRSR